MIMKINEKNDLNSMCSLDIFRHKHHFVVKVLMMASAKRHILPAVPFLISGHSLCKRTISQLSTICLQ